MRKNDTQTREAAKYNNTGVQVNNTDIPLLADIFNIMQEINQIEQRREWQQGRMFNITQHFTVSHGGGSPKGFDDVIALLSELDEEHEQRCKDYVRQLKKAQKILNNIESRSMRTFVMMKYIMNSPDVEIRKELNMTRRGFERARSCIESAPCMAAVKWRERYIVTEKK